MRDASRADLLFGGEVIVNAGDFVGVHEGSVACGGDGSRTFTPCCHAMRLSLRSISTNPLH